MPTTLLKTLYKAFVLPYLTYCCCVWRFCSVKPSSAFSKRCHKGHFEATSKNKQQYLLTIFGVVDFISVCKVKQCLLQISPSYLTSLFLTNEQFGYTCTQGRDKNHILQPRTEFGRRTFSFKGSQLYNTLPSTAHQIKTLPAFIHFCISYSLPVS